MAEAAAEGKADTFDVAVCLKLRRAFAEILAAHPEVRSLACSVDWNGPLNEANVMHGVWLGEDGIVSRPDAVFGSIAQTMRILDTQFTRAVELNNHLREQLAVLATEATKRNEEVQRLDKEIEARRALLEEVQEKEANVLRPERDP